MSYKAWKDEPFYFAPIQKLGGGWIAFKSSPSAPPAPDYAGAAQATAAGDLTNLKYQTAANRPDQITPWGNSTWSQDPSTEAWTQTLSLSPQQQAALNDQQNIQANQSNLAQGLQGQVASTMAGGFNAPNLSSYMSGVNGVNQNAPQFNEDVAAKGAQASYKSQMDLLQPQMTQDTTNLDSKLRLQGLTPGTEAYNTAAQNLGRTQAATTTQVANQAVLSGNQMANADYASALTGYNASNAAQDQAHTQGLQDYSTAYSSALQNYLQPLNSMNAVLSGNQVQSPTMPSFTNAGVTKGADVSGAASALGSWNQGIYNSQASTASSGNNAALGAAASAAAIFF